MLILIGFYFLGFKGCKYWTKSLNVSHTRFFFTKRTFSPDYFGSLSTYSQQYVLQKEIFKMLNAFQIV